MQADMSQIQAVDVIVVGAGMVGLTAGLALHNEGFKTLVIDGRDDDFLDLAQTIQPQLESTDNVDNYDNRVSALTKASENIFRNLAVWPKMTAMRTSAYRHMHVWDGEGTGVVDFSSDELHQPCLGHIVENSVALAALINTAKEQGLTIMTGTKVVGLSSPSDSAKQGFRELICERKQAAQATVSLTLQAKLVVGADGAMSKVRQLSNIPLWQYDYGHNAIVATVKTTNTHANTAWQCFTSDGPLAFLPLSDANTCSIVWSTSVLHAQELMQLDETAFLKALSRAFEHRLGDVLAISERAMFPLRQRHAKHYIQSGLALIGDASHTIHPLAGQGVNLGLLDVAALVQVLCHARKRKQHLGSQALLLRFQRMRQTDNLAMSASMQAFKWLFEPQNSAVTIARNVGMHLFNKVTPIKQHIVTQAMGLSGDLPKLASEQANK
ncbi:UbiH/UbiF/VisC/COQ6 family ubiquinone biosynthesis hydroxylase [Gammaproteobacteria bacterium AS21]